MVQAIAKSVLIFLALAVVHWSASAACSQESIPTDSESPEAFIAERKAAVGEVPRGKIVLWEYVIENKGRSLLQVTAKTHCGCTVASSDQEIPPGGKGKVKVELRTTSLRGKFNKTLEVQTNDPLQPSIMLAISGTIIEAVEVDPTTSLTFDLKLDGSTEHEIGLRTIESVSITDLKCETPHVKARLVAVDKSSYRLKLSVSKDAPLGQSSFALTLATTAEYEPWRIITIRCQKGVMIIPPRLAFGVASLRQNGGAETMVLIRGQTGDLQIRGAKSNDPKLTVKVLPVKEGHSYRVILACDEPSTIAKDAVVTVELNDPLQPTVEIPVVYSQGGMSPKAIEAVLKSLPGITSSGSEGADANVSPAASPPK